MYTQLFNGGRSRGQLLLISALALAAIFIGLAMVVNTVIFTENRATRANIDSGEPIEYLDRGRDVAAGTMTTANYGVTDEDYDGRLEIIRQNVSAWQARYTRFPARHGSYASSNVTGMQPGVRVIQSSVGELDPANASLLYELNPLGLTGQSWQVADSVKTREYQLRLERSSLPVRDRDGLIDFLTGAVGDLIDPEETFSVRIEDSDGHQYHVFVYRAEGETDQVNVSVAGNTDGGWERMGTCSQTTPNITVGLTNGTIVGTEGVQQCPALSFMEDVAPPYDVHYANGDDVRGTYQFIADEPESQFRAELEAEGQSLLDDLIASLTDPFDLITTLVSDLLESHIYLDSPNDDAPYTSRAVYSTTLHVEYATDELDYEGTLRVAPGEPDHQSSAD